MITIPWHLVQDVCSNMVQAGLADSVCAGADVVVKTPFTREQLHEFLANVSSENRQPLYQHIANQQKLLVVSFTDAELDVWVRNVVASNNWLPAIINVDRIDAAIALQALASECGQLFFGRLRASIARFIPEYHAVLATGLGEPATLGTVLALIALFNLGEAVSFLEYVVDGHPDLDVHGQTSSVLAARAIAGVCDPSSISRLEGWIGVPGRAAACYDGLVAISIRYRDDYFWPALVADATTGESERLHSICRTLLSNPPSPRKVNGWLRDHIEDLFRRARPDQTQLVDAVLHCFANRRHLVELQHVQLLTTAGEPVHVLTVHSPTRPRKSVTAMVQIPKAFVPSATTRVPPSDLDYPVTMEQVVEAFGLE